MTTQVDRTASDAAPSAPPPRPGNLDYAVLEEQLKAGYRAATAQYRRDDEIEVATPNHRRLEQIIRQICGWFPRPIQVLDVGCGTGRYFHCLQNVERLVGLDISEDMLAAAAHPVLEQDISVGRTELMRGNAYLMSFPSDSFDFIYSLGMFGHGCPVTLEVCNRFHDWLKPGGKLLFNVVDFAGLPWCHRARRRVRNWLYPNLSLGLRQALDRRQQISPFFCLTSGQLRSILSASRFKEFSIVSHACQSPLWTGRHLEAFATK